MFLAHIEGIKFLQRSRRYEKENIISKASFGTMTSLFRILF